DTERPPQEGDGRSHRKGGTNRAELPRRRSRRYDYRRTVIAGDRVRQLPGRHPGPGRAATVIATQIRHRELGTGRREMERTAIVDSDRTDVAHVHVLERCATGNTCAEHRCSGAVNVDVLEVDVRD